MLTQRARAANCFDVVKQSHRRAPSVSAKRPQALVGSMRGSQVYPSIAERFVGGVMHRYMNQLPSQNL
jgi:hypothetical protein